MNTKIFSTAVVATVVFAASVATPASATTFEIGGVIQSGAVPFTASLQSGTLALLERTDESHMSDCTESHLEGKTTTFTGAQITAPLSALTFGKCNPKPVVVHKPGQIFIEHIPGTTNGTAFWENGEVTIPTTLEFTVNCKSGGGTLIGTLTGVKEGSATLHVKAVLNCGFLLPSAYWEGTYILTSPKGLGITA